MGLGPEGALDVQVMRATPMFGLRAEVQEEPGGLTMAGETMV
jgi:hypothetical protein